jgi:tetratricopeptide (TPR) repeat protein
MLPNQPVVANNLASLISTYRDDEASLERAYTIARRLRGTDVAPFQDTYGWIAYRKGEYQEALEHLEPAAAVLGDDPLVQYHLGMTYLALGQQDAALDQLRRAVDLAGPGRFAASVRDGAREKSNPWRPNRQTRRKLALPFP